VGLGAVAGAIALTVLLVQRHKSADEVASATPTDGGVSPPEVIAQLRGPKKAYVGSWSSARGKASHLDIGPRGGIWFRRDEGAPYKAPPTEGLIAAFEGNDIKVDGAEQETIRVTVPPHEVDGHWEMTAQGVGLLR